MCEGKCACKKQINNEINSGISSFLKIGWITLISLVLLFIVINKVWGMKTFDWKCVVGEAAECGYYEMKAITLVYRNRLEKKMDLGCVALKREDLEEFVMNEHQATREIAKQVVKEVFIDKCPDFTNGAIYYENVKKYGEPRWAPDMIITLELKCHTFYKEK